MAFFGLLCAGIALAGIFENLVHARRLRAIPVRIHVNGTRGKSTTTRLIAAGLRAGGRRVIAKTTGTAASIIWEDGSEEPLRRERRLGGHAQGQGSASTACAQGSGQEGRGRGRGRASIAEQMRVAALAARRGVDALVLECMALDPENQWVSEHKMIRSTIGVITNVRDDHLDVMGPRLRDVARAISLTIPRGGVLVTAERAFADVLEERARAVGASVHVVDGSAVPDEVNEAFPYVSFKENVACALKACELAGVPRDVAISGMLAARGDPGVMRILAIRRARASYILVNAFAANDSTSTSLIWSLVRESLVEKGALRDSPCGVPVAVVMNNRADRVPRIRELALLVAREIRPLKVFLVGEAARFAKAQLARNGVALDCVTDLTALREPEAVLDAIDASLPGGAVLFAIGNTKGMGQRLAEFFQRNGEVL